MNRTERLVKIALSADNAADKARYIHEIQQHNMDVDELRGRFDDLARIVEEQGRLITDLARMLLDDAKAPAGAPIVLDSPARVRAHGVTIVQAYGNHQNVALDIVDEGDHVRIRVREPSGKASFSATDADLQRIVAKLAEMINRQAPAGREPPHDPNDDFERIACNKAGQVGHWACGWCAEHNRPSFECLCNGRRLSPRDGRLPFCGGADDCAKVVTHGGRWHYKKRWWCDDHVPMSGHHEWCPTPCRDLVRAITKPVLWDVIAAGHSHLR